MAEKLRQLQHNLEDILTGLHASESPLLSANRAARFVALDGSVTQASILLDDWADQMYARLVSDSDGDRQQHLQALATESSPTALTQTLLLLLKHTDGFNRGVWFPQLVEEFHGYLTSQRRVSEAQQLGSRLWSGLQHEDVSLWLPADVKNDIIRKLQRYVDIDIKQIAPGTVFSYQETSPVGTVGQAARSDGLSPQHR